MTSDGFSAKHPNFYKNLSTGGINLGKKRDRINFINQFYNDQVNYQDLAKLNVLLGDPHPGKSFKEQKRDILNSFYNKYTSSGPPS
jgi:hypothetical protein